jgi:hypothetical protein
LAAQLPDPQDIKSDIEATKNIRLTSKRFYQTSSHPLVRRFDLALDVRCLESLEDIFKTCQGERISNIDLRYYSPSIAGDFRAFAAMCSRNLGRFLNYIEGLIRDSEDQAPNAGADQEHPDAGAEALLNLMVLNMSLEDGRECISKGDSILSS